MRYEVAVTDKVVIARCKVPLQNIKSQHIVIYKVAIMRNKAAVKVTLWDIITLLNAEWHCEI